MNERRMRVAACAFRWSRSRFAGRGDGAAFRSALSERLAPLTAEASSMPHACASVTPAPCGGGDDDTARSMIQRKPEPAPEDLCREPA